MIDKYQFDEARNGFFYNEDPECRKLRGLDETKPYIVWYNGENSIPYIIELQDDSPVAAHRLLYETTVRTVKGSPRWGQRANSAVFDFYQNGLVYIMPEKMSMEEMQADWRVNIAVECVHIIQEHETNFVPIITYQDTGDEKLLVPSLAEIIGVEKDDLPAFYVMHPFSDQVVQYEDPLNDPDTVSAQGLLLWGRRTILYLEAELFERDISAFEQKKEKGEETIEEWEMEKYERAKKSLAAANEEREVVQKLIEEEIERL